MVFSSCEQCPWQRNQENISDVEVDLQECCIDLALDVVRKNNFLKENKIVAYERAKFRGV